MPLYIVSKKCKGTGVTNATQSVCNSGSTCKDTVNFFGTLATKLKDMAESIHTRIEEIKKQVCHRSSGFLLAQIEAPRMVLGVRYEYVEYIKRHGPPDKGIFDEVKLDIIRTELGIDKNENTI